MTTRWVLVAALVGLSSPAGAGTIRGVLRVPSAPVTASAGVNPYPGRAGAMSSKPVRRGVVTDAVLSIERIPAAAESALTGLPDQKPELAQQSQSFNPRVLAVAVGTVVDFPDRDPIFHNVFSVSPVKRFDLGKYPRGQSRRVTFLKSGLVQVYCDIHADMAAFIVVLPNHAFTRPDPTGSFALPSLPAGEYTLKVWHPDLPEFKRTVQVQEGKDVRLDLTWTEGDPKLADEAPGRR